MSPHLLGAGIPILLLGAMLIGAVFDFAATSRGRRNDAERRLTSTRIGQ